MVKIKIMEVVDMTVTTVIRFEVSQEELNLIRSSLCDRAMKELSRAHDVQRQSQEEGKEDSTSWIYMDTRNKIHALIETIDKSS